MIIGHSKLYLEAIRFFKPQGTILLFLPCLVALALLDVKYSVDFELYIIFFAGAFLVRSSACVINDLWDIAFDKRVRRTQNRPLASGRISKIEAIILVMVLLLLALICLMQLKQEAIIAGLLAPLLFTTYPLFKRFTYMPQIYLGICMSYGVLMAGLEIEKTLSFEMITLFIAMIFWTFGYDTIYAYQDIEDDEMIGVKSSALFFGSDGRKYLSVSYIVFLLLVLVVATKFELGFLFFILLNVLGIYILARLRFLNFEDAEECGIEFGKNVGYGFYIFLSIILSRLFI